MSQAGSSACPDQDRAAIREACLDYVAGFLASDAERVARSVSPELAKRTVHDGVLRAMTREQLIRASSMRQWPAANVEVEIDDVFGDIATARITSLFVDYAQLARLDGRWQVVNVLWLNRDAVPRQGA